MTLPTRLHPVPDQAPNAEASAPVQPTVFQEDASRFSHRPDDYAAMERNVGIHESNRLRVVGEPGLAWLVFFRSYKRQLRILGLGYAGIPGHRYLDDGPGALS